jgi:predicted PurR-regulated permease PerM
MIRILYALSIAAWALLLFPYPSTLFLAACFACFSLPMYVRLAGYFPGIKSIAAYTAILIATIVIPATALIVLVVPQARAGYNMLLRLKATNFELPQAWLDKIETMRTSLDFIPGLDAWLSYLSSNIEEGLAMIVRTLVSGGYGFIGSAMTVIWAMFLFVTFSVMGVVYAERFRNMMLLFSRIPEEMLARFITAIRAALRGVFMGILLVALAQGVLCGIGFYFAGVSQPAFWGLLATLVAPIPVIGTSIVWGPLAAMLWFSGSMAGAVGLCIWGIVAVAGVDNILRPLFLKRGINAPLFVLVLAILCGLYTFGPVGLILGPVLVAFSIQAVREGDKLASTQEDDTG